MAEMIVVKCDIGSKCVGRFIMHAILLGLIYGRLLVPDIC